MMQDGVKVFQYVKSKFVAGKIGVHGESLGGSVAAYIGSKCNTDFVFVDRSFSSLQDVAYWTFGGRATAMAYKIFTRWSTLSWPNFVEIKNTYKLLGADPND